MNRSVRVTCSKFLANLLQLDPQCGIVQALTGFRVYVPQGNNNRRGLSIIGNEITDNARPRDIYFDFFDRFWRAVIITGNHGATLEALFSHHPPAGIGSPDRLQAVPVNTRHVEKLVTDLLDKLQVLGGKYVAVFHRHHDSQIVAEPLEAVGIIAVVENVLV